MNNELGTQQQDVYDCKTNRDEILVNPKKSSRVLRLQRIVSVESTASVRKAYTVIASASDIRILIRKKCDEILS